MEAKELYGDVTGAAIEVHRLLGSGLLESAYDLALARELVLRARAVERQKPVPLEYKGVALGDGSRLDLLVDERLLLEIKGVETLPSVSQCSPCQKR